MEFEEKDFPKSGTKVKTQFILELKPSRFEQSLNNYCLSNLIATIINLRMSDFVDSKRISFLTVLEKINDVEDENYSIVDLILSIIEALNIDLNEETKNEIINEIVEEIGYGNLTKYNY